MTIPLPAYPVPEDEKPWTLSDWVHFLDDDPELSDEELASRVVKALMDAQPDLLVVAMAFWINRHRRARVRRLERKVLAAGERLVPADPLRDIKRLVRERGFVPNKGYVPWGQMTAEDHLARARLLRFHARDTIKTAEMHEAAARLIESTGARCLDDLPDDVVATVFTPGPTALVSGPNSRGGGPR